MELANRAGKPTGATATPGAEWNAQVQQNLHYPRFNLLQLDQNPDNPAGRNVERWRDNRIGWSQDAESQGATRYRYDSWGNRTQALHSDGSITALHYDSLHQLRQVVQIDAQGKAQSNTTYRYDAFGRRVSKTHQKTGEQSQTTHYGWDGDRLVHTETAEHIHHTVYEPGSFVPLLQVQRSKEKEGNTDPVKTLLGMGNSEASNTLEQELPREERELLHQALKEALQPSYRLSELMPQEMRAQVRESIHALKNAHTQSEEQNPLAIRHVLTDHLGTPIGLVNANGEQVGQVAWAARYTAWGQVEEEYNPNQIHQPIRFQGQQLDAETNLHYNRFRYYDPSVGQYITQDPIGLSGGFNKNIYPVNPLSHYDSLGLLGQCAEGNCSANEESIMDSAWKKIKGAFPNSKEGWVDYLGKQADIFGAVSVGMAYSTVLAPAAPVAAAIGSAADAGAKMLKPPANIVHATDTVLDIAGAGAPGGFFKDAGLTALKKVISIGSEMKEASSPRPFPPSTQSCKKSDYQ